MSKQKTIRKFYKTVVTIEVLSEYPFTPESIKNIDYVITEGDCSGTWDYDVKIISPQEAARSLIEQGSEPGFFQLDEDGNDVRE